MRDAEAVTFAGSTLDRASRLRDDPAALAAMRADPRARCLPVWRGRPLMDFAGAPGLGWQPFESPVLGETAGALTVFLGLDGAEPRFAQEVPDWDTTRPPEPVPFSNDAEIAHPDLPGHLRFGELRAAMASLSPADGAHAAAAKGILAWHASHGFCAACGAPSEPDQGGWRRRCGSCGAQHFPRTDPVVIMLVTRGNSLLLGRQASWPPGMYSLLAGFMEPGETIEAAVRRETMEETGIEVGRVAYLASQPWPFPSSLMIGCHGEALTGEITIDEVEIEDAIWVSRERLAAALAGQDPQLRPARPGAIARFLIERWLADRLD